MDDITAVTDEVRGAELARRAAAEGSSHPEHLSPPADLGLTRKQIHEARKRRRGFDVQTGARLPADGWTGWQRLAGKLK
jgi:hypothetical protein